MSSEVNPSPVKKDIPLCIPEIRGNEWQYVRECLDTGWVSSVGSFVERFEGALSDSVGGGHAVATVSGTAALHIALLAAGVEPEDEVLVPSLTFIATANAVRYAGAWPVFIDAEPDYWQIDPKMVAAFLEGECEKVEGVLRNRATGRRVKAIVPVHILGHPADMDPILELARRFDLAVIEDATEGLGGHYKERPLGSLGHIGCFSFNGNKMITTGGGGMLVTANRQWAEKARYLTTQAKDDPLEYVHGEIGFNYRLTNLQAAMGCAQVEQLDDYLAAKRRIASTYQAELSQISGIAPMPEAPWARSAWWLYSVAVDPQAFGMDRRELMHRLDEYGIQTRPLWQPLHLSPAYAGAQRVGGGVAERLNRTVLSLPCSVGLDDDSQRFVIDAIKKVSS